MGVHSSGGALRGGVRRRGGCTASGGLPGPLAWPRCCGLAPGGPAEPVTGGLVPLDPSGGACAAEGGGAWPGRPGAGRGSCEAADGTARSPARHRVAHGHGRAPASGPTRGKVRAAPRGSRTPSPPHPRRGTEGLHPRTPAAAGHQCHELRRLSQRRGRGAAAHAGSFPLPRQPRRGGTGDGHHPWPADEP